MPLYRFCRKGLHRMEKAVDPLHDINHLHRVFANLEKLLKNEKRLRHKKIDFAILMITICWHDVWISHRFPRHLLSLAWGRFCDGICSASIFRRQARRAGINPRLIQQSGYHILTHPHFFVPPKTIEGKIFWDIDRLDEWSLERLKALENVLAKTRRRKIYQKAAKIYFRFGLLRQKKNDLNFRWSKREFTRRRKKYLKIAYRLLAEEKKRAGAGLANKKA